MQLNYYQHCAAETAVYPKEIGIAYTALGLAGEAGEVANKVKKIFRDDGGRLTSERKAMIKKELGGVLWYLAMTAHELGLSLDDIAFDNLTELRRRAEKGTVHGDGDDR